MTQDVAAIRRAAFNQNRAGRSQTRRSRTTTRSGSVFPGTAEKLVGRPRRPSKNATRNAPSFNSYFPTLFRGSSHAQVVTVVPCDGGVCVAGGPAGRRLHGQPRWFEHPDRIGQLL